MSNRNQELIRLFPEAYAIENLTQVRRRLRQWFRDHQRDLPWRRNKTAYRIWISEIMLQQTQVATVVDYYRRFLKRFPTVTKLAAANVDDVLVMWEGLGYYRRARQLHDAAQRVVTEHGGTFPSSFDDVLALPGIGRYTAGAILSIAENQRLPVLEGNTIRLHSRLLLMRDDPRSTANQRLLWQFAECILPARESGDFNQALMELGATVCTPTSPACERCPLARYCPTFVQGLQKQIPLLKRKIKYESVSEAIVLVQRNEKYLVRKCLPGERWAGLWDFPRYEMQTDSIDEQVGQLSARLRQDYGLDVAVVPLDHTIKHAVTKFRITLTCFSSQQVRGRLKSDECQPTWMSKSEIEKLPMSVTGRKIANRWV